MKRIYSLIAILATLVQVAYASNTSKSVVQVTSGVNLTDAVDYHITSSDMPFSVSGSVNIINDDAVLFFDNIKPSKVNSTFLSNVYINGQPAQHDVNCRIAIYITGAAVFPHPNSTYNPLTVYTEKNYGGKMCRNYVIGNRYTELGEMDDDIESFKLKRGYMCTLATSSTGKGYSRVFIAQDADIEVPELSKYLKNKVSFIRVFQWNNCSKRGSASGGTGQYDALNATWFYDWSAGDYNYLDYEYVPMRHHVGWPSFTSIMNNLHSNSVLGNNEPDNTGDEKQNPAAYSVVIENWEDIYMSGMRVGSPAMASNVSGWLVPFMNLCKLRNYRVDFVAFHKYSYASGSSYSSSVNSLYSKFGRPVWLTEYNYGASWTKETGWPDSDRSGSEANQQHLAAGLNSISDGLEGNSHMERYSIYSWVQSCRHVYEDGKATIGGQAYADHATHAAYTGKDEVIPEWNYWSPTDLVVEYSKVNRRAALYWNCWNYEETDSCFIERLDPGETEYKRIAEVKYKEEKEYAYEYDDLDGMSGTFSYRIHNYDNDGNQRYSGVVTFTIGSANGSADIQFGSTLVSNTESLSSDFTTEMTSHPAVFLTMPSDNNREVGLGHIISAVSNYKADYRILPWQTAGSQTLSKAETIGFMAIPYGTYQDGAQSMEVGFARVNGDTCEVEFDSPFPEGITPVVVADVRATLNVYPIMTRVFDITNRGFKCQLVYEEGANTKIVPRQTLNYMAATKGQIHIGGGKVITAGASENVLKGTEGVDVPLTDSFGEKYALVNPLVFASVQNTVETCGSILRNGNVAADGETAGSVTVRRQLDASSQNADATAAETLGWIVLSDESNLENNATDASLRFTESATDITATQQGDSFKVSVNDGIISVTGADDFEIYATNGAECSKYSRQAPGTYFVKVGNEVKKILVK